MKWGYIREIASHFGMAMADLCGVLQLGINFSSKISISVFSFLRLQFVGLSLDERNCKKNGKKLEIVENYNIHFLFLCSVAIVVSYRFSISCIIICIHVFV